MLPITPLSSSRLKLQAFGNHSIKTKKSFKNHHKKIGENLQKKWRNGYEKNKKKDNQKLQNSKENMFFTCDMRGIWNLAPHCILYRD